MINETTATPVANGNWSEQRAKLKTQFPDLTDADLTFEEGKKDQMLVNLQAKLGKTQAEFDTLIASL